MLRKNLHTVLLLLITAFAHGGQPSNMNWTSISKEEIIKVFENINSWFKNTSSYSLTVTHASYEDYQSEIPADKSVGYFKKDKTNYHSCLLGIHTIQNDNYKIVIDTVKKLIMVANPDKNHWGSFTLDDYNLAMGYCSALKFAQAGKEKYYRMEFKDGYPMTAYEFSLNEQGQMKQSILYYSAIKKNNENEKSQEKISPRLTIVFSDYKKNPPFNYKEEFDDSRYFIKGEKKFIPAPKYQQYKIRDQRFTMN